MVYSGAVKELRQKITGLTQRPTSPLTKGLADAIRWLDADAFERTAESMLRAVVPPEHLILAHTIQFVALLEETKLLEAMAEERVLETLSSEAAAEVAKCYSISPEILIRLEDRVPPSVLQLSAAARSPGCMAIYVPAALDRAKSLADEQDYTGVKRVYGWMKYLFEDDASSLEDVFSTILLHSSAAAAKAGDIDDACEGLELASRLCPGRTTVFTELGLIYSILGRYDRAIVALGEAVKLTAAANESERAVALCRLGSAYLDQGDTEHAEATFREALQTSPANWPALEGMTALEVRKQMRRRLQAEGLCNEIKTTCAECKTSFAVQGSPAMAAVFEMSISQGLPPGPEGSARPESRLFWDCPHCGAGLVLSGLTEQDGNYEMGSSIRRPDDRQPWEWWLWPHDSKEPEPSSFHVYRAV